MYAKEIVTDINVVKFWDSVINHGAHLDPPKRVREECWDRWLSITWEYVYTDKTVREIGRDYNISRQYVRILASKTSALAWKNCPKSMQSHYPLSRLVVRKVKKIAP